MSVTMGTSTKDTLAPHLPLATDSFHVRVGSLDKEVRM